ncbi:hypothetical protein ACFY2M_25515 [Streptomyces sp. NPDC001276]
MTRAAARAGLTALTELLHWGPTGWRPCSIRHCLQARTARTGQVAGLEP